MSLSKFRDSFGEGELGTFFQTLSRLLIHNHNKWGGRVHLQDFRLALCSTEQKETLAIYHTSSVRHTKPEIP